MQREKELMARPCPDYDHQQLDKSIVSERYDKPKFPVVFKAELYNHHGSNLLIVTFFQLTGTPFFRLFQSESSHFNQDLETNKRSEATFQYVDWYDSRFNGCYLLSKETDGIIKSFLGIGKRDQQPSAIEALMKYQKSRAEAVLKARYDKIKAADDIMMLQIRPIPKDFQNWMDEVPLVKSRYIFYQYYDRAELEGYCTACKQVVKIKKPHHNTTTKCPNCGRLVTYKTMAKSENVVDEAGVALIQKITDGYVIRYFTIKKYYYHRGSFGTPSNYMHPEYDLHEKAREFEDNDHQLFVWGDFRQTGEYRFCKDYSSSYGGEYFIYNRNLKELFKNEQSRRKYFPFAEFLRHSGPVRPHDLLTEILRMPQMEYLAKLKLYRFLAGGLNGQYNYGEVIGKKKDIESILGLAKSYLPIIQKMNLSFSELEYFARGLKYGLNQAKMIVDWYRERHLDVSLFYRSRHLLNLLRFGSPIKLTKYLSEQRNSLKGQKSGSYSYFESIGDVIDYMKDYVENCIKLGYDLKNDFVLYPRDLKAAHDQAAARIVDLQNRVKQEKFARIADLAEETNQYFAWKNDKLLIRAPRDYSDLIKEGQKLHHCVGTYAMDVAMGETVILFIRRIEDPEEPFYTLEFEDNKISQCRGKSNCATTPEVQKFIEKWEQYISKASMAKLKVV